MNDRNANRPGYKEIKPFAVNCRTRKSRLDIRECCPILRNSIPAKPLLCMLNCGGFFYAFGVSV